MIIETRGDTTPHELDRIRNEVERSGLRTRLNRGPTRTYLTCVAGGAHADDGLLDRGEPVAAPEAPDPEQLRRMDGVVAVHAAASAFPRAAREGRELPTVVRVGDDVDQWVGGKALALMAGPCSVEGRHMLMETAHRVRAAGAGFLRGGAFKPRTSPYAFQGMGIAALELLAEARRETGLPVVTEVMDPRQAEIVAAHADVLQIGARNMQNFSLLKEVGRLHRPVLLKRGPSATIRELLLAAEHLMAAGTDQVILCERGIRTFENETRNTLDVSAVPVLKRLTHLPVIVDPSHAGGDADLVAPLAYAAIAAGADGLIIEVHPDPANAKSDGDQSLTPDAFDDLARKLRPFAEAAGRTLADPAAPRAVPAPAAIRGAA